MPIFSLSFAEKNCVFEFNRAIFDFKNKKYVLYPGSERNYMSIDTTVNGEKEINDVFKQVHEFLYLYGWENNCSFHFIDAVIVTGNQRTLLDSKIPKITIPRRLANIQQLFLMSKDRCSEEFNKAISLYNDAQNSNDIFYRFFCLYKIFGMPPINYNEKDIVNWINNNLHHVIKQLPTATVEFCKEKPNLGQFLKDDCRNAVAHLHRNKPQSKTMISYDFNDYKIMKHSCEIIDKLAIYFINTEIGDPGTERIANVKIE